MNEPNNSDVKWEHLLRFRFMEIMILWEGRLTTKHLQSTFGIKRAQASRDIAAYKNRAPGNIEQDASIKGYKPSSQFKPVFTQGNVDEYFNLLASNSFFDDFLRQLPFPATNTHILKPPPRLANPAIIQSIVKACRNKRRLEVVYGSMSTPAGEERIIAPHSIVSSGYRWHTRAFCEKNRDYRDFLLGRILGVSDDLGSQINDKEEDYDWHKQITLELIPHPDLSKAQQKLVRAERCFEGDSLTLTTRRATAIYLLQMLQIPTNPTKYKHSNPLVLKDPNIIEELRFSRTGNLRETPISSS